MGWRREYLDIVLVTSGLMEMIGYHLFLLYRCLRLAHATVIGYENQSNRAWVQKDESIDKRIALTANSTNISAAMYLCAMSLALGSLIGAWAGSSSEGISLHSLMYGDTRSPINFIKHSLFSCFLVALASFVQSIRCFVQANFLMRIPTTDIPVSYVQKEVVSGTHFWALGIPAFYFAITFLLWIFGPIPMFLSSVVMVVILHMLDTNSKPLHQL
ncbi:LOW QUALITY PROTEIN: Protein of unknown function DUF599 [Dillenia turbinata]|uniref:Uncharacterized protein n=1 Tax=Dillenia turbinata TaxID=194707 RepID=A0AAN8ZBI7_9MAGN